MKSKVITFLILIALFPLGVLSQTSYSTQTQKKIALVIGNGNYQSGNILANPENDAMAMKSALQLVGFTVLEYENLTQSQMKKAIDEFGEKLKSNDVGLFFYAGHGIQAKGYNYLIPVDAELKSEQQVEYDCVQADRVLALMEASGSKVNIIILDACRNNPFERSWTRSATGKGLAFMNAPSGTLIAYATSPGSTASDGSGKNGLYTSAILESIQIPNISVIQMFQNVRAIVSQKSSKQQIPWESTSLVGDFYLIRDSNLTNNAEIQNIQKSNQNDNIESRLLDSPVANDLRNEIRIVKIVKKPNNIKSANSTIIGDTTLYATLNKGQSNHIKSKSYLNIYLPTYNDTTISGEKIQTKPDKIGHIQISNSFSNTSEGKLYFDKDFDYKKFFNPDIGYAKIKKTWSSVFLTQEIPLRRTDPCFSLIVGVRYMFNGIIGGYVNIGYGRYREDDSSQEALDPGIGLTKSIGRKTYVGLGISPSGDATDIELFVVSRLKNNLTLFYGVNFEAGPSTMELTKFPFGIGYSF